MLDFEELDESILSEISGGGERYEDSQCDALGSLCAEILDRLTEHVRSGDKDITRLHGGDVKRWAQQVGIYCTVGDIKPATSYADSFLLPALESLTENYPDFSDLVSRLKNG